MNAKNRKTIFIIGTGLFRVLLLVFLIGVILMLGNSARSALAGDDGLLYGFHNGDEAPLMYIVNTTDDEDDGSCDAYHCSLREALHAANSLPSADLITFNITGEPPYTIQPRSELPNIADPVTIDGTSQPNFEGIPMIELDGSNAGEGSNGLSIGAGDSTVKGLFIDRFSGSGIAIGDSANNIIEGNVLSGNGGSGISIAGENAAGNVVRGNLIGTNPKGTDAWPNTDGIWLGDNTHNNTIGGTTAEERNIISGNMIYGISVNYGAYQNQFSGNYMGTDWSGTEPVGNGGGILLGSGSNHNLIGGTQEGSGNLISGNWGNGVTIADIDSAWNIVQGNYIGTDATGSTTTGLPGPVIGEPTLTVEFACFTYDPGTDYDGFVSESDNPLAPWSGSSVHFKGTDECGSEEKNGEASRIYRYRLEFEEVTQLTSVAVSGAAFNGPDNVLRVLDEDENVLGMTDTYGGNSFQTTVVLLQGVEGKVFFIDEFDTSSTWRYRQRFILNGSVPLGNRGSGVIIANGATDNLIGGTAAGAGNLISGNRYDAVGFFDPGTKGNRLEGNFIGTDTSGSYALPNTGAGVWIGVGASDNIIGGTQPQAGNVISGNSGDGISINDAETSGIVVQGNYIGTTALGSDRLPNFSNGIVLVNGTNNNLITENLISANGGAGIAIFNSGTSSNTVHDNKIGTDVTGMFALGNAGQGVVIGGEASRDLISSNLISGNGGDGISIFNPGTDDNIVQGNLIGTEASGNSALPNGGLGVWIGEGAADTLIGGVEAGQGNLISGNTSGGIGINHLESTGTRVLGNYIGTNRDGDNALPNGGDGVYISASQSTIGGEEPGAGNLISGNTASGVAIVDGGTGNIVQGNYIGTDATGSTTTGLPGPEVGDYDLNVEFACPTYDVSTDIDGFVSQSDDPLAPWSGSSVHFKGTVLCGSVEKYGEASLIYRYRLEFEEVTQLTSVAVSGAAFNGPNNVLRVLDEDENVLGMTDTYGGNSFQTIYLTLQGVEGKVFYIDEFDTSSTWRFRQSITLNFLGNRGSGVAIANGATSNLIGGTVAGAGNLISGNGSDAVSIAGSGTNANRLEGNFIGTDASGSYALPNNSVGVWIGVGASNNIIGGTIPQAGNVISGNNGDGISVNDAETTGNEIWRNYIGTDALGNEAIPNLYNGIVLVNGTNNNLIKKNLISGNGGDGVAIYDSATSNNKVQANYIGTDVTGMVALGNTYRGIVVAGGASENFIRGNLISANGAAGIRLTDGGTEGNKVQGNLIGTDITGKGPLGNGYIGIRITDGAANNLIGGEDPDDGNTIAFNADAGIKLNPAAGSGNSLLANSIFSNAGLGIDLNEDDVTPNDVGDSDSGPNGLQNYPVFNSLIKYRSLTVFGNLDSIPNMTYHIEFFSVATCDESGYGEGDHFLGSIEVIIGPSGSADFIFTLPKNFSPSSCVTATATDAYGSTSEFAMCKGLTR
jgi:CSLREA domain-containing protein